MRAGLSQERTWSYLLDIFLILGLIISTTSCEQIKLPVDNIPGTDFPDHLQVDPLFNDFYIFLGGEKLMGPVVSHMVERDGKYFQYTMNGLMVFNPNSSATEYFTLFPIGKEMGIFEKPSPSLENESQFYLNGHVIGEPFRSYYDEQRSHSFGLPLTEMFYNRMRRRYEQYFEGVAFYKMRDTNEVGLLAYGSFMCGNSCEEVDEGNSVLDFSHKIASAFSDFVYQYGIRFTGFPISDLIYMDSKWIQIFQNVVLTADTPENPDSARLHPMSIILGVVNEDPLPPSGSQDMNFYSTMDGVGYDIPIYFWDYLMAHGGLQVAGPPVSHLQDYAGDSTRQCFENLCLIRDGQLSDAGKVYPYQMGYQFLGLISDDRKPIEPTVSPHQGTIVLRVEERQPTVRSDEEQEILVTVLRNGQPVSGITLELIITLPDRSTQKFVLPETDTDGNSVQKIPMIQAENASVILYQICVLNQDQANFCYEDSYTIWNQP